MREDIKKHIGMIQKGEVPEGYKKTKVGIIPMDWNIKDFGSLCSSKSGKYNANADKKFVKCIELENIVPNQGMINGYFNGAELESTKNVFEKNNVLYGKLRPYLRKYYHTQCNGVCSSEIWVLKPKKTISSYYLYLLVQSDKFNQLTNLSCCGSKMPRADWEYVEQTLYPIPAPEEQEKIVKCIMNYEKKVEKLDSLINQKKKYKKGLMQDLLTGNSRLKCFDSEWKKEKLGKLFSERSETNMIDSELLSITSTGIIPRSEIEGKDNSSEDKSKYKKIYVGDIGYNTMRMWQGVSAYSNYEGIVSPAYTILKPKDNVDAKFFSYLFKLPSIVFMFYRYSQGLVDDTRNLKYENFKKIKLNIPTDIEEQKAIAKILSQADKEIELLQQQLEQIKLEKKAMMQLLLTGIVRVNQKGGE